jgi:hypothetical protein
MTYALRLLYILWALAILIEYIETLFVYVSMYIEILTCSISLYGSTECK